MCCCGTTEVLLCRNCIATHNSKFPDRMHIILPIKAREYSCAPGYLERLTKRQQNLQLALTEGLENLTRIGKCEQRIIEQVEKALQEITYYRSSTLSELHDYKALLELKIHEARAEVEAHLYEDAYIPEAPIARAIWDYAPGSMALFTFMEIGDYEVKAAMSFVPGEVAKPKVAKSLLPEEVVKPKVVKNLAPGKVGKKTAAKATAEFHALSRRERRKLQNLEAPQVSKPVSGYKEKATVAVQKEAISVTSVQNRSEMAEIQSSVAPAPLIPKPASYTQPRAEPAPSSLPQRFTPQLVWMDPKSLAWFDFSSRTLSPEVNLRPEHCVEHMSSAALLSNGKILVCGKRKPASDSAFIVNPANGEITHTSNMITKRGCHGMQTYGESVFVFGGKGTSALLVASEIYSVEVVRWREIKDMRTPRSHFNPCMWGDFVYLFGGKGTNNCEMYDIMQNDYIPLLIKTKKAGPTSAAVQGSDIVLLQPRRIDRWRIGDTHFQSEKTNKSVVHCWGNMNPVIVDNTIFVSTFYLKRGVQSFEI